MLSSRIETRFERAGPVCGAAATATGPTLSSRIETRFERAGPEGATATATGEPAVPEMGRRPVATSTALKPPTLPRRSAFGGFDVVPLDGRFFSNAVTSTAGRASELRFADGQHGWAEGL